MKYVVFLLLIFSFTSCEKLTILGHLISDEVPSCIMTEIKDFEKEMNEICDEGAKVVKYEFQDQIVYTFVPSLCLSDGATEILDENCQLVCTLGTIVGIIECNGENFDEKAKELKVVWTQ